MEKSEGFLVFAGCWRQQFDEAWNLAAIFAGLCRRRISTPAHLPKR